MIVQADWALVVLTAVLAGIPALIAAGGLYVKVARLEEDVKAKVSRELFDERLKHIDDTLVDIKRMLRRVLGEQDTQP